MKRISLTSTKKSKKNKSEIKPVFVNGSKKQLVIVIITICAILILLGLVLFGKQFVGKAGETGLSIGPEQGFALVNSGCDDVFSFTYTLNSFKSLIFNLNIYCTENYFSVYDDINSETGDDNYLGCLTQIEDSSITSCCIKSEDHKCVTSDNKCYLSGDLSSSYNYNADLCDIDGDWIRCTYDAGKSIVEEEYAMLCTNYQWHKCDSNYDGKIVVTNQLCINNKWLKCDASYNSGPQTALDGTKYICSNNKWSEAPKTENTIAMCTDNIDNDADGYTDCHDSDCKSIKINQYTCIQSSILTLTGKDKWSPDQNSLKPENLAKRSEWSVDTGDCVQLSGLKVNYFKNTTDGTFLCGDNNIWIKCTPEGEGTFKVKPGYVVGESPTKICKNSKWVDYVIPEMNCENNLDDDKDKLTDCLDALDCEGKSCGDGCSCAVKKQYGINIGFKKETACNDNTDNDGDKLTDCTDYSDCENVACEKGCLCIKKTFFGQTVGGKKETFCDDKSDNDGDAKTDCSDPDCTTNSVCAPKCIPSCSGKQCGGDGCGGVCGTCAEGAYCQSNGNCTVVPEICNDNKDNDGDGKIDCFDDDCIGQLNSKNYQCCRVNIDSDKNGIMDQCLFNKPICDLSAFTCTIKSSEGGSCIHGFDDDADGKIDCADPDCTTDPNCICSDTDKGKDYPTFGIVTDKENPKGLNDSCTPNGKLQEYFCLDNKFNSVTINCDTFYGPTSKCVNNACACTPSCTDKQCGDNGCGGSCGTCSPGNKCESNKCVSGVVGVSGDYTNDKILDVGDIFVLQLAIEAAQLQNGACGASSQNSCYLGEIYICENGKYSETSSFSCTGELSMDLIKDGILNAEDIFILQLAIESAQPQNNNCGASGQDSCSLGEIFICENAKYSETSSFKC